MEDLDARIARYEEAIAYHMAGIAQLRDGGVGHFDVRDGRKVDTTAEVIQAEENAIAQYRELIALWSRHRS